VKQRIVSLAAAATLSVSASGIYLIKKHEGDGRVGYRDPVGVVTACHGHTATAVLGKKYTTAECYALLLRDLKVAESAVKRLVKVPIAQQQYDVLVSFTFNLGEDNFARSTLLKKLNSGDCVGAANEFPRWNKADGKVLRGLTNRRAEEGRIFLEACHVPSVTFNIRANPAPAPTDLPAERRAGTPGLPNRGLVGSV
jgi:lysozyme